MKTMERIKSKLKNLPLCPGVYIMRDDAGQVIYVGKSKLLKNRVSQYFMQSKNHTPKTMAMVANVYDFDYMITDTEVEALVLECNLIKKYRPKYNILLKDDKQYPYIKITVNEEYPRIYMTRKVTKDGAKYFGPYMSAFMVKDTLETVKRIFRVRSCNKNLPRDIGKSRPCLYYHLKQCSAPCDGKITQEEYREVFDQIAVVLEGKYDGIIKQLKEKMQQAAEALEFERAARYRDKIESLSILGEKQKIISTHSDNRDIIAVYCEACTSCVQIFYMREGKISGSEYFVFENTQASASELVSGFVKQYYFTATNIPKEILLSEAIEDLEEIQAWLSQKTGHKIILTVPKRGEKWKAVQMVAKNAEESLRQYKFKRDKEKVEQNDILAKLQDTLNLPAPPFRIESYDISNISGAQNLGVCVVYQNAMELKKNYRTFHVKSVEGANDYESMREVIHRRFSRAYQEEDAIRAGELLPEKARFLPLPDLILVDGGRGHVSAIQQLMDTLGEDIPIYGLVKDDKHRTRALTGSQQEFELDEDGSLFKFLSRMQDEVHRFAITQFRKRYEKENVCSELEKIRGIGAVKRKKLLETFISIARIKSASEEELCQVVDAATARRIIDYFKEDR